MAALSTENLDTENTTPKIMRFKSNDDQIFNIEVKVAKVSQMISQMLTDLGDEDDDVIPLPNINSTILTKVVEWMKHHQDDAPEEEEDENEKRTKVFSQWDQEFIKVDNNMLFELILAANYLDIKGLMDLGCKSVAELMKGKTPEEMRKMFGIKNDFTPEEEEQIRKENEWCEEK